MSSIKEIESLQFKKIGNWELTDESSIKFIYDDDGYSKINNALYAFVDTKEEKIKYIGKTTVSLSKRFYGYVQGHGQSTNNNNKNRIIESLQNKKNIEVYALLDEYPINWGKYNINLAAGLEDSLIAEFNPEWNGGKSETETREIFELKDLNIKDDEKIFIVKLGETYFKSGYLNPGVKYSHFLGEHGEALNIIYDNNLITTCIINRKANGSERLVRLYGGKALVEFYQSKNFQLGQIIELEIIDKNTIKIL